MLKWLQKQVDKIGSPELDWVQVEITTHCNTACRYCPRNIMGNHWNSRHMPMASFSQLLPFLKYTGLVYLQGWGEPLLHPRIFEMIGLCKGLRKTVGFTTNGMLLSEESIRQLVDLQVDIVAVSFAGTRAETHNRIRKGTDFDQIVAHLQMLSRIKLAKGSTRPAVHMAYIMLASGFDQVSEIIPLARKIDAVQVVASNVALVLDPDIAAEALFHHPENTDEYRRVLAQIKWAASKEGIDFDYAEPETLTTTCCSENIERASVVNVAGEVSPCVFTSRTLAAKAQEPPGRPAASNRFNAKSLPLRTLSFGNINAESLTRIWHKKEYMDFRRLHCREVANRGIKTLFNLPEICRTCYKWQGI